MSCDEELFRESTNDVWVKELTNSRTGAYENAATVTAEVLLADDTVLEAEFALAYVAGSDGNYYGNFYVPTSVEFGDRLKIIRVADVSGEDEKRTWTSIHNVAQCNL